MKKRSNAIVHATAVLALVAASAGSAQADRCMGAKLKALGKAELRMLICNARVASSSDDSTLTACLTDALSGLVIAFASAGVCSGDQDICGAIADDCQNAVSSAFTDAFPSSCEFAKRRAAAKLVKRQMACYAKAAKKDDAVDAGCLSNAAGKFSAALAKAGECPDGGSALGLVQYRCVTSAAALDMDSVVVGVCPALPASTTTTSTTTTSTTLCGGFNFPFELPGPFAESSECVDALFEEAANQCCSDVLESFEFDEDPHLCRGSCSAP